MRIKLSLCKSLHENAAAYYNEAKEAREKIKAVEKAIEETKREIEKARKNEEKKKAAVRIKKERKWYEKFHWFFTSNGRLVIAGRSAQENDILFLKHLEDNDLFFHADIEGAAATVLKDGKKAEEQELKETAQFAACFSKAWKMEYATVDSYCVEKDQVSKYSHGEYLGKGAFMITGERRWFRNIPLLLRIGIGEDGGVEIVPHYCSRKLKNEIRLTPGGKEKGDAAKRIAKKLNIHIDEINRFLPAGRITILE